MSRELNLVPQQKINVKGSSGSGKTIIKIVLVLLLTVGVSFGYSFGSTIYYNKKLAAKKVELNKSKDKVEEKNRLIEQIDIINKQITKANQLRGIKNYDTKKLLADMREKILIDGVTITQMNYTGKNQPKGEHQVKISGTSPSKDALQKVWAGLRETDDFKNSKINKCILDKDSLYTYELVISFEGGSDNESKK